MLKKRGLAVNIIKTVKDKVTCLREYEFLFNRKQIFFLDGTELLQEQLLFFP
jgi:hypothetical protein